MDNRYVSKDQINRARNANLAEYFIRGGYDCDQLRNELHIKGFEGLYVNTVTNQWYCFGGDKGGTNAVNCLTEIIGMDFQTAVQALSGSVGCEICRYEIYRSEKKSFKLPERANNMRKVFAYLCQTRKISSKIVSRLVHQRLLYQDVRGNAVFVHCDEGGNAVGAEIQGTNSKKRYKSVAPGTTDSVFSVNLGEPRKCYVFESAIDLMSFWQLADPQKIQGSMLVSMAGLKYGSIKRIADSGMTIYSCTDNDSAGQRFTLMYGLRSCQRILEENNVKDFNELLQKQSAKRTFCP